MLRPAGRLRPCVSPLPVVYVGVTTHMAIADSTDIAYERAYEAHWSDVFRFALAWTNDWTAAEDLAQRHLRHNLPSRIAADNYPVQLPKHSRFTLV